MRQQGVPGDSFFQGNNLADELARRGALVLPSTITCGLFYLNSCFHSLFFWDWRRTVPSKFFNKQVPLVSIEELELAPLARCVVFRLRYNRHRLLLNSLSF